MASKKKQVDTRASSRLVVDGIKQAPSRAMLRAVGFQDADFSKPQIGIASTWANITPCNMHIAELAREAVAAAATDEGVLRLFRTTRTLLATVAGLPPGLAALRAPAASPVVVLIRQIRSGCADSAGNRAYRPRGSRWCR